MWANKWKLVLTHLLSLICVLSEETNFDEGLYKLVNQVLKEYFQVFRCVTFAADAVSNVEYVEKSLPLMVINLSKYRRGKLFSETFEQGCGGYIIQTPPERRLWMVQMLLDAKNETVSYRYNKQKYLFLPVSENDTDLTVLLRPDLLYLPNFLFVTPEQSGRFSIKTHSVFNPGNHEGFEVVDLWSSSEGYHLGRDLYPDKIKNINGKKLVFGVMHYVPYSVVVHEGNKTTLDGLEGRIGIQFVNRINGTYDGLDHPEELWGTKFPNGSGTGIFGSVQRGDADLGYSAVYQWYCDVLDCTYPYVQAEVTCLVPKPQILTSWHTILLPFTTFTWICLFVAFLVSSIFLFGLRLIMKYSKGVKMTRRIFATAFDSAFVLFRLQIQQPPRTINKSNLVTNYIKVSILYHFLVILFWQGGIASILTIPRYEQPIDSVFDLVSRYPEVRWGANHDVWIHSIENATEPVLRDLIEKFVILPPGKLEEEAKQRRFGFFMEKLHGNGHYGFNEYINEETIPYLKLMKNYVYTGFCVIILPRGSPYLEKLDELIHRLIDTGIVLKMETQVSLEVIDNHLQNMIRYSSDYKKGGKAILTVGHIKGPVFLYIFGIFISVVIFFGEIFLFRQMNKTKKRRKRKKRVSVYTLPGISEMQIKTLLRHN